MLAFSLGIAGSFSLGSLAANEIDATVITAARFIGTVPLIGLIAAFGSGIKIRHMMSLWRYAIAGGLMAAYFVLMFEGLKTASAVSTSAVFTLTPIMSGVFGWIILRQIITLRMALALFVGAMGAIWVIFQADLDAIFQFRVGEGEAIFFIGCIFHAIYTPLARRLNRGESPAVFVFGMSLIGAIMLVVYGWEEIVNTDWKSLPFIVWTTLAYLTIVSTTMTFIALNYAAMRLPSAKVMAYTYITPSWVIVWEAGLGRGIPPMGILLGVLATIAALLILLRDE